MCPEKTTPEVLSGILGISLDQLEKLAGAAHKLYSIRRLPKKTEGYRIIEAPTRNLKALQRNLNERVFARLMVHPALHGRMGTSQITSARIHVRQPMVVTMDLSEFFPSVTDKMILDATAKAGFPVCTARLMTRLCTRKRRLPQGAPTSPILARIVITPVLYRIEGVLKSVSPYCRVTQFVDDLAMSGPLGIVRLIPVIKRIWSESGFIINPKKTRIMARSDAQEVLGIWVNDRLEPSAEFLEVLSKSRRELSSFDPRRRGLEAYFYAIQRANVYVREPIVAVDK